ncbi:MAG TPA: OsmC family protein [Jatrophihabitans sp.]|nr:OsmC family protein [Jatrophihabitans sp.]
MTVEGSFTGAHLLHLAVAGCVLNDTDREAEARSIGLDGVRVVAFGDFDTATWQSTGISHRIELESEAGDAELAELLAVVDAVAEIPKAVRAGAEVARVSDRRSRMVMRGQG